MPEFAPIEVQSGPLIQAHVPNITGAEWPKFENVGAEIVSAAAKGAEINGRTRKMEEQIMAMQLAEKNKDIEHDMAMQRMAQGGYLAEKRLASQELVNQARISDYEFKQNKYYGAIDDYQNLLEEVHTAKLDPKDPDYWAKLVDIESRHSAGAMTPAGRQLHRINGMDRNKAAKAEADSAFAEQRSILNDTKMLDWHGLKPTTAIWDSEGQWGEKIETDNNGNPVLDPVTKQPKMAKFIQLGTDMAGKPQFMTLPKDEWQQKFNRYQTNQRKLNSLPEQIIDRTDPANPIEPYAVDRTGGGGALPLPSDKSQMILHQPYTVNGKNYMWDGTKLVPQ